MKSFRKQKKRGPTKFQGIVADAKNLGVTYSHLWRVLKGHRKSPLLAKYRALQADKAIQKLKNKPEGK